MSLCTVCGHETININEELPGANKQAPSGKISFHCFPLEVELKKEWIIALERHNWSPSKGTKICSLHFEDMDLDKSSWFVTKLKPGAVPQLVEQLLFKDATSERTAESMEEEGTWIETLPNQDINQNNSNNHSSFKVGTSERTAESMEEEGTWIEALPNQDIKQNNNNNHSSFKVGTSECTAESMEEKGTWIEALRNQDINQNNNNNHSSFKVETNVQLLSYKLDKAQKAVDAKTRQIKSLHQKIRRSEKKMETLKQKIKELDRKCSFKEEWKCILKGMSPLAASILERELLKKNNPNFKQFYNDHLKSFALCLSHINPEAYTFVRKSFGACLPHPQTLINWQSKEDINISLKNQDIDEDIEDTNEDIDDNVEYVAEFEIL